MYIQKFWSDYKTFKFGSHQGTNCKLVKINETEKGELFNKTPSVSLSTCRPIYPKQMPKFTSDCPTVHTTSNPTPNNKTHTTQPTLALPRTAGPLHYLLASYPRQWPATTCHLPPTEVPHTVVGGWGLKGGCSCSTKLWNAISFSH